MIQYQITLIDNSNKYRPVSTLISSEPIDLNNSIAKKEIITRGIKKICAQRYWTNLDLKKYGYTAIKIRVYDKEKIDKENVERYNKIKEEKYASGEWKRPKKER